MLTIDEIKYNLENLYLGFVYDPNNKFAIVSKQQVAISKQLARAMFITLRTKSYIETIYHTTAYNTCISSIRHKLIALKKNTTNSKEDQPVIVKTDISHYYNSITASRQLHVYNPFINLFANRYNISFNNAANMYSQLFYNSDMLIPGFPHAGLMATIMSGILKRSLPDNSDITYSVYADDITAVCRANQANDALSKIRSVVNTYNFRINKDKTHIYSLNTTAPIILGARIVLNNDNIIVVPRNKAKQAKRAKQRERQGGWLGFFTNIYGKDSQQYRDLKNRYKQGVINDTRGNKRNSGNGETISIGDLGEDSLRAP